MKDEYNSKLCKRMVKICKMDYMMHLLQHNIPKDNGALMAKKSKITKKYLEQFMSKEQLIEYYKFIGV